MSLGFHFDDVDEILYLEKHKELPPMGAPCHEDDKEDKKLDDLPPMGAPYHD